MKNNDSYLDQKAIAERAYQLYLARGGKDGHDLDDWIRAERELRQTRLPELETSTVTLRPRPKR